MSLCGEPEALEAHVAKSLKKVRKLKRLGNSLGSLLGHILKPLPHKVEPTSVLLHSFVSPFSRAFLAAFRSRFLEEIVESGRRPMCVRDSKNGCFHKFRFFDEKPVETDFMMTASMHPTKSRFNLQVICRLAGNTQKHKVLDGSAAEAGPLLKVQ